MYYSSIIIKATTLDRMKWTEYVEEEKWHVSKISTVETAPLNVQNQKLR